MLSRFELRELSLLLNKTFSRTESERIRSTVEEEAGPEEEEANGR